LPQPMPPVDAITRMGKGYLWEIKKGPAITRGLLCTCLFIQRE
jgi:hypothetical protein